MFSIIKSLVKKGLRKRGYQIVSNSNLKQDPVVQAEFGNIQNKIEKHFSLSKESFEYPSFYSVYNFTKHVSNKKIMGDIIELGVFRGAKIATALMTLNFLNDSVLFMETIFGLKLFTCFNNFL